VAPPCRSGPSLAAFSSRQTLSLTPHRSPTPHGTRIRATPRHPHRPAAGCFALGTDQGFRIYNCEPFKETFRRDFTSGGIGVVEMLFRCNILALVGGGKNPRYPPHKVMIWDDHQNRCIGELSFRTEVKAVRLRRDRVVVALSNKVYVYNFADLSLLDHIETVDNPRGLLVVCPNPSNNVIACPGMQKGHVRVEVRACTRGRSGARVHELEVVRACRGFFVVGFCWRSFCSEPLC
jgi:hypothetical protein